MVIRKLNSQKAYRMLENKSDEELVAVLNGASSVLGDTAWSLLHNRNRHDLIIRALKEKKISTRDGKVRALNFLLSYGRKLPDAFQIYLDYSGDKSKDAADCALFGLAFWQDSRAIPCLESKQETRNSKNIKKAIDALRSRDPKRYSPCFHDAQGVWLKKG